MAVERGSARVAEIDLTSIRILSGVHKRNAKGEACVMEWVAIVAGEPWGDSPKCACPVLAAYARRLNDGIPDDALRTRLLAPLVPLLVNSRSTPEVEQRRRYVAADRAMRVFLPMALDAAKLPAWATTLRALAPVTDRATAEAARTVAGEAGVAARKAADAADAAAAAFAADAYAAYAAAAAAFAADADAAFAAASYAADAYAAYAAAAAADAAADAAFAAASYAADAAARIPVYEAAADCLRAMCEVR